MARSHADLLTAEAPHVLNHMLTSTGMVDPEASLTAFQAHRTKEVLSPTRTFDFNDSRLDAHYVTMTSNLKVSRA